MVLKQKNNQLKLNRRIKLVEFKKIRIDKIFDVPQKAQEPLRRALALLPVEVYDFIIENYTIHSLGEHVAGAHWNFEIEKKPGILLFAKELWGKKDLQIIFVVAHEVAHAFKKHNTGIRNLKDEREAENLALEWLSEYYERKDLLHYCHYL